MHWNRGSSRDIAETKRDHMDSVLNFNSSTASKMVDGPLRRLAMDIHRVLFLHPDCYGSIQISGDILERVDEVTIPHALRVGIATSALRGPLTLRDTFKDKIVENLIRVLAELRDVALVDLGSATATVAGIAEREFRAATPASAGPAEKHQKENVPYAAPTKKRQRDQEPYAHPAGSAKRTRLKTTGSLPQASAKTKDINIDILGQLPTPFGPVRFGVAPYHPEVKNHMSNFDQVSDNHHDRKLGIPENNGVDGKWGVVPARQLVAWYNGLPEAQRLCVDLKAFDKVVVIGHGNVALGCARILLTDPMELASTDIAMLALNIFQGINVRHLRLC
ncbi:NADPH-adrenodoxin reductase [Coemansia sp. S146]|nr:NADPH-adrenodoxin reductase [Coemansia sp. S146]